MTDKRIVTKMSSMAGDPYLAFPEFKSSYIECGKRAHASHVKGGIRAMGYLESEGAWRLRFPNTTNADGTVAPGVPYPEKAEMPDEPPAGHTQASTPAPESANAAHGYHDGDGYAAAAHSKGNGGPRSDGYGGQRSDGHGGQRSDGYGGPRSDGYGGQRSDGNRAHSPRRTDDRIDTLEKALAKLIDTLATKDNPAPKDARHSTTHFSFLASY